MKVNKEDMTLYAVTDRNWLNGSELSTQVEDAIKGGATFVQLREKNLSVEEFIAEGKKVKAVTDKYKIPFVINDNIEVMIAVGADGVHVGQGDMDAKECKKIIGEEKIVGVSVKTVEQALEAQSKGADYVGVGAAFDTSTKKDANTVTFHAISDICKAIDIPVVAIGGISEKNILELKGLGVDGVAVVSAIFAKDNVEEAAKNMLELSKQL